MVQEIENFYGVYLLYNINPNFKGRTYIGFTVNPNRRIQQHNKGKQAGGAWRTHGRGPWEMVLIIHGFPNEISALRFEWAWQHPDKSRRLRHLPGKKKKETQFLFRFRIVSKMLRTGPWNRLALTIRWLKQEYVTDFAPDSKPPVHMPIAYGLVKVKKVGTDTGRSKKTVNEQKVTDDDEIEDLVNLSQSSIKYPRCSVCNKRIQNEEHTLKCIHPKCVMISHTLCLSNRFLTEKKLKNKEVLPVDGICPKCKGAVLWGDLVRLKKGCYKNLVECGSSDEEDEDHWANDLQTQVT